MTRWHRILIACSAALLVTACGEAARSPLEPEGTEARRNGGLLTGGNDVPPDSTYTVQSTSGEEPTTEEPEATNRNGGLLTGGN